MKDLLRQHYNKDIGSSRFAAGNKVIRTYNECFDRIVDHETGKRYSYKHTVGKGDISVIIEERTKEKIG